MRLAISHRHLSCLCISEKQKWQMWRGTLVSPGTAVAIPCAGFAGANAPTEGRGWHWTYSPAHVGHQVSHHPSSWERARCAWGVGTWPQAGGCTNKPSSTGQIKVSHLSKADSIMLCSGCAKWMFCFADAEHPDLSSKVSSKPTSFDREKTWLLLLLKWQHMDFRH